MDRQLLRKRQYMTVDSAIEMAGFGRVQILYLLAACVVSFTEVQIIMTIGLTLPSVQCEWDLNNKDILTMLMVGSTSFVVGGLSGGVVSDKYGRRKVILYGLLFMIVSGFLATFQQNFVLFLVCRAGCLFFFTFIKPSSLCMILEITPRRFRFLVKMALMVSGQIGATCASLTAFAIMNTSGWRMLLFWMIVPCITPLIIYIFLEESPRFLLVSGKTEEGVRILRQIYLRNGKEDVSSLVRNKRGVNRGQIGQLFTPEFEKTTLIVLAVFLMKNLISSTIHVAIPFIIKVRSQTFMSNTF